MKPFTKVAAIVFGIAAILHLIRVFYPVPDNDW
jgi:hypothetical protein